eukprot:scaffold69317_cov31-Attheya_sp.AAC.1
MMFSLLYHSLASLRYPLTRQPGQSFAQHTLLSITDKARIERQTGMTGQRERGKASERWSMQRYIDR